MSPTTIKELDGLPSGEIRLAITESEQRTVGLMEQKLAEHQEAMEKRLDKQDERLEAMQADLTSLVGTDKVPGLITRNTELLENIAAKHEKWHEQDAEFRADIADQMAELNAQHKSMAKDIKSVRWFIRLSTAIARCGRFIASLAQKGTDVYKALGIAGIVWLSTVQFMHYIWPVLSAWLHHLFR